MEKTNEEILISHIKKAGEEIPHWLVGIVLPAMEEAVTQRNKRIEGIIDEEIKHLNTQTVTVGKIRQRVYDSRVKWLNELKQKINNGNNL